MDKIEIEEFNKYIKQIIFIISFVIICYIVFDELIRLSIFTFRYKYYNDYGNNLSNICGNDNIEYETGRFQSITNINDYKLTNDIYNRTNYILILLIISVIFTIIICYCFGIYFYNSVIEKTKCFSIMELGNDNTLKQMIICFLGEKFASNINICIFQYIILLFIIVIIPISILLNIFLNFDINLTNGFYLPFFVLLFVSILISRYYVGIDISFCLFLIFLTVFISSLLFYNNIWKIYNNYDFSSNDLYKNNTKDYPNKYNNSGDKNFYKRYSGKISEKPVLKTTVATEVTSVVNAAAAVPAAGSTAAIPEVKPFIAFPAKAINEEYTLEQINAYEHIIINSQTSSAIQNNYKKYLNDKKDYEEKLKDYEEEFNSFNKFNILKDDDELTMLNILLNFIGIKNTNDISIYILILIGFLIVIIICLFYIYNDLLYNVFIIIFNVFIILLLINCITITNTYINKYFIYKNSNLYKYDINKINNKISNMLDNINLNGELNPVDKKIGNIILYNIYSSMFSYNVLTGSVNYSISNPGNIINYHNGLENEDGSGGDVAFASVLLQAYYNSYYNHYLHFLKTSGIYDNFINGKWINPFTLPGHTIPAGDGIITWTHDQMKSHILHYNIIRLTTVFNHSNGFIINNAQFLDFIFNVFLEDINNIKILIKNIEDNIISDYCSDVDPEALAYGSTKLKKVSVKTYNETSDKYKDYIQYKKIVNTCLNAYKKFVLEIRDFLSIYLIKKNVIRNCNNNKNSVITLPPKADPTMATLYDNIISIANNPDIIKFNNIHRNFVDVLYKTLNFEGIRDIAVGHNIMNDIIDNYNHYNDNDDYSEKKLKNLTSNEQDDVDLNNESTYSETLLSNMSNVSNSIYIIVLLSIIAIIEPIYI